jgi:hypothetical protein
MQASALAALNNFLSIVLRKGGVSSPFSFFSIAFLNMITSQQSPYLNVLAKKRAWTPVQVAKGQVTEGAESTLLKALALRHLEIPVKELLEEGMKRELPSTPGLIETLRSNQDDEDRHLEALNYVADAHGTDTKSEREVMSILKAWNEHPAHPILKAGVMERSVFFVALPFFRQTGDVGMRTVSQDISRDERVHTVVNAMVSKELGEKESQSLDKLRAATVAWLFDDLGASSNQWLNKDFWLRQSRSLFWTGKAPEMAATRSSRCPAFFESPNTSLPMYS